MNVFSAISSESPPRKSGWAKINTIASWKESISSKRVFVDISVGVLLAGATALSLPIMEPIMISIASSIAPVPDDVPRIASFAIGMAIFSVLMWLWFLCRELLVLIAFLQIPIMINEIVKAFQKAYERAI